MTLIKQSWLTYILIGIMVAYALAKLTNDFIVIHG